MLLQNPLAKFNDFRFVSTACFFYPDAEIIGVFGGSGCWSGLNCVVQVFSRFIQARRRGMKCQLSQPHPSLRHSRVLWKIVNESLQRWPSFFVALGSLH